MSSKQLLTRRFVLCAPPALALAACASEPYVDPYANAPLLDWMDARMEQREISIATAFFDQVNAERSSRGLIQLIGDRALSDVSYDHAASVFRRGVFGRTTPEDRYPYENLPEIVKNRYALVGGAQLWKVKGAGRWPAAQHSERGVTSWMGVKENRMFLLEPDFNRMGVGVVEADGDAVVVVLFGQINA